MKEEQNNTPARASAFTPVSGKLPALSPKNLKRLSVFLTRGNTILSEAPVNSGGAFHLYVAPDLAKEAGVSAVLGPRGLDSQSLAAHSELPRIALSSATEVRHGGLNVDFAALHISDELIDPWWIWCREYTVSGTLETSNGCPIGAEVTVYNVTSGVSGLVETPIVTVTTDANGNFTATFNWCSSRFCWWPCWPIWWRCWPWWWELDILAVVETLERRIQVQSPGTGIATVSNIAPLRQPNPADLVTGVGFASARAGIELQPDSARTALIASKFADPAIREIFPWWWWCCENPNIVFSASQGTTVVLNEDPNTSTRWCFPSGQTVSLTGNSQAIGGCPVQGGGDCAFAWTSVGGEPPLAVLVENISMGYADGFGGACSNLAFADSLNLNGAFSGGCVAFYQVLAGQWGGNGNPARGGTPPLTSQPLSDKLVNYVSIWRNATLTVEQDTVILGPCNFNGYDNLYVTLLQRQSATTPASILTQIGNFPALGPGDFVIGWAYPELVLTTEASELVTPAVTGGVNLAIAPFDLAGNPISPADIDMGPDMTLMIDTTPLTSASIDSVTVWNADGSPATATAASTSVCPSYQITPGGYVLIHTTVIDNAEHLCEYYIATQYGNGSLPPVVTNPSDRDYAQAPATFTPPSLGQLYGVDPGYGVPNDLPLPPPPPQVPALTNWTFVGGGDTIQIMIPLSCCYDFQLWVSKRTTNGQTFACAQGNPAFQTVNITVVPL
jgi:hypothetical protein